INRFLKERIFSFKKSIKMMIIVTIASSLFLLLSISEIIKGNISVGLLVTVFAYFGKVVNSLLQFSWSLDGFLDVKTKVGRFMTILGAESYRSDLKKKNFPKWNYIKLNNIFFGFENKKVLNGVSLKIKKGDKIAIVGQTGCGKSTLSKLLLNLYVVNSGEILVNNTNLNDIKEKEIHKNISIVLQESEVFNSTIRDNITFGINNPQRLSRVVKIAQLNQLIKSLPDGLDTLIGEKGYKLSGGERQRIGIARALFKHSDILILDEATSSLDVRTEKKIVDELSKLNITQIIIAHRLSTIMNSDKIVVMEKGKIIEEGTHKELMMRKEKYYELSKHSKGEK
ncbi:ATP-binding cassette domain-containing protein, partial [Candidatus Woesearchaeota archaeon]|nr:ATP-binding cassette domain-containing protein [Candidatus Woesearchaeota archaeon]